MSARLLSRTTPVFRRFLRPSHVKRTAFFVIADCVAIFTSLTTAFLVRFDFAPNIPYYQLIPAAIPLFLGAKLVSFSAFRLYTMSWRFVGLRDLANILLAVLFSSAALIATIYALRLEMFSGFPRGVILIDAVITFVLVAALRIAKRVALEVIRGARYAGQGKRTIIIGAGNTGEMVLRDMQRTRYATFTPVAFLDDDANLHGSSLHGVRIIGALDTLPAAVGELHATAVIIAIQTIGHQRLRWLHRAAKDAGVEEVKIVPHLYDVHQPQVRLQAIEDIKIEDLLRRQAVRVDDGAISRAIAGRGVLITGAAGSIGSEIVRQVCRFNPREVICFEIDETELHQLWLTLRRDFPMVADRLRFVIGDICDADRIECVLDRYHPDIIFHAAAYKHVPMMEWNPSEAVRVNIVGTRNVARAACRTGVERFVLISTDKAIRPTSVMGATKRVAEQIGRAYHGAGRTAFLSVRFGNVLGSRGSVLPIFLDQLRRGGPLTVTHEGMRRYFMTIPEAVALVLQANAVGRGGEVAVLDMGDPVRIVEFAEELIRLHGLRPYSDIGIEYIGMRPGEKLFEELLTAEEGTVGTSHQKIFIARSSEQFDLPTVEALVEQFHTLARFPDADGRAIRQLLRERVRWYDEREDAATGLVGDRQEGRATSHPSFESQRAGASERTRMPERA